MITGHVEGNYKSSWTIVIELDKENGKRERVKRSIKKRDYKTKAEAERFMNQLIIEMEKGTYIEPSGMTLSVIFEKRIPHAKKGLGIQNLYAQRGDHKQLFQA
jgi:hypothetical protein